MNRSCIGHIWTDDHKKTHKTKGKTLSFNIHHLLQVKAANDIF